MIQHRHVKKICKKNPFPAPFPGQKSCPRPVPRGLDSPFPVTRKNQNTPGETNPSGSVGYGFKVRAAPSGDSLLCLYERTNGLGPSCAAVILRNTPRKSSVLAYYSIKRTPRRHFRKPVYVCAYFAAEGVRSVHV